MSDGCPLKARGLSCLTCLTRSRVGWIHYIQVTPGRTKYLLGASRYGELHQESQRDQHIVRARGQDGRRNVGQSSSVPLEEPRQADPSPEGGGQRERRRIRQVEKGVQDRFVRLAQAKVDVARRRASTIPPVTICCTAHLQAIYPAYYPMPLVTLLEWPVPPFSLCRHASGHLWLDFGQQCLAVSSVDSVADTWRSAPAPETRTCGQASQSSAIFFLVSTSAEPMCGITTPGRQERGSSTSAGRLTVF